MAIGISGRRRRDAGPPAGGTLPRRRLRVLVAAAVALSLVLASCGTLVYVAFRRKPVNHPAAFLSKGRAPGTETVVVSAGSSTTHATLSGDYVAMLRERFGDTHEFVNAGVNGDTSAGLLGRLDEIIACRPDAVTLLIGANDLRDGVPPQAFRANLDEILRRLRDGTDARIAVLSVTPHGERVDSAANRALAPYHAAAREAAAAHDAAYLPLYETMTEILRRRGDGQAAAEPPPLLGPLLESMVRRYVLRQSYDEIARSNGLLLLTDHRHLSDRGADVVADLIATWLTEPGAP